IAIKRPFFYHHRIVISVNTNAGTYTCAEMTILQSPGIFQSASTNSKSSSRQSSQSASDFSDCEDNIDADTSDLRSQIQRDAGNLLPQILSHCPILQYNRVEKAFGE